MGLGLIHWGLTPHGGWMHPFARKRYLYPLGAVAVSVSLVAASAPGSPTGLDVKTLGDGCVTVALAPPASDGGSRITGYTMYARVAPPNGDGKVVSKATGPGSPLTVCGLKNGVNYYFTATATNAAGEGVPSGARSGIPRTVPGAPKGLDVKKLGDKAVTVAFGLPESDGGSPITLYTVYARPASSNGAGKPVSQATATSCSVPVTVSGLTNGTNYNFTVSATNAAGEGSESVPRSGTPSDRVLSISKQPSDANVGEGSAGTFSIVASLPEASYQWYRRPKGMGYDSIPGAKSASYTTPPLTLANSGDQYFVRVSYGGVMVESQPGTLTVTKGTTPLGPLAAFPGCEGGGCGATGGRGGVVYTVNTLDDIRHATAPRPFNGPEHKDPWSLRDALLAPGPKTVVFLVSGTITLKSMNDGNKDADDAFYPPQKGVTIAGQTSPGGIQIKSDGKMGGGHTMMHLSDNTVVRYVRFRPGPTIFRNDNGNGLSSIRLESHDRPGRVEDVVIDHCSFAWDTDKPVAAAGVKRVTLSWNIIGEALKDHATGPLINLCCDQSYLNESSFDGHHNLLASDTHRLPQANVKYFRWINNLVFGYQLGSLLYGGVHADMIGNVFDGGVGTDGKSLMSPWNKDSKIQPDLGSREVRWAFDKEHNEPRVDGTKTNCGTAFNIVPDDGPSNAKFYLMNNFGHSNPDGSKDNFNTMLRKAAVNNNSQLDDNPIELNYKSLNPVVVPAELVKYPITITNLRNFSELADLLSPKVGAYQSLSSSGAWAPNRDSADTQIVGYIKDMSKRPIDYTTYEVDAKGNVVQSDFENAKNGYQRAYPDLAHDAQGNLIPAYKDSDGDGMPDEWETAHGLNPNEPSDCNTVRPNANGYTNLELYLSGLYPNGTPLP